MLTLTCCAVCLSFRLPGCCPSCLKPDGMAFSLSPDQLVDILQVAVPVLALQSVDPVIQVQLLPAALAQSAGLGLEPFGSAPPHVETHREDHSLFTSCANAPAKARKLFKNSSPPKTAAAGLQLQAGSQQSSFSSSSFVPRPKAKSLPSWDSASRLQSSVS